MHFASSILWALTAKSTGLLTYIRVTKSKMYNILSYIKCILYINIKMYSNVEWIKIGSAMYNLAMVPNI